MKIKLLLTLCLLVIGCQPPANKITEPSSVASNKCKYVRLPDIGLGLYDVEYEGHHYLYMYHGSLIHSESCPCKTEFK